MPSKSADSSNKRIPVGCVVTALVVAALLVVGIYWGRELTRLRRTSLPEIDPGLTLISAADLARIPLARGFDFRLGSRHGALAYNAQPFRENDHLGDDLNGIGGENTDLGDPIHATANGLVVYAAPASRGWGNLVLVQHCVVEPDGQRRYYQSLYAHLDRIDVVAGQIVYRGQVIGTVGNADGLYWAHLHFEIRSFVTRYIGPGYRVDTTGWQDPTEFILRMRGRGDGDFLRDPGSMVAEQVRLQR